MKNIIGFILAVIILSSCEKVVELDGLNLDKNLSKIVINGSVTNGPGPHIVKITKSNLLSDALNTPTVDNAVVTLSDDVGNTETLTFNGKGIYESIKLVGQPGRTYTLEVKAENQTYTSKSTMPQFVKLDDIRTRQEIYDGDTTQDLTPVYTDPPTSGNFYRFVLKINDKLVKQNFIISDVVLNGKVNKEHLSDLEERIVPGDKVSLLMQNVDQNVGLYYITLNAITDSGPDGGATPTNPPSNISNGSLGIFSAHTVDEKIVIIK
jgi:hypothetical protein